jgi:hypothetical protein
MHGEFTSAVRAIVIIIACGVCFGAAGGLLGLTLAVAAPSYYRGIFRAASQPDFSPVEVGLGLGTTQGLIAGLIVGSVVVLSVAISDPRPRAIEYVEDKAARTETRLPWRTWIRRALLLAAIASGIFCGWGVGFVVGQLSGRASLYRYLATEKVARIRPVLREGGFGSVTAEVEEDPHATEVFLRGHVTSKQARESLEGRLRSLFGDEEARMMASTIEVVEP